MELYKKNKVNSCGLPADLLQIPIFFSPTR